jgi:hypothetical protein
MAICTQRFCILLAVAVTALPTRADEPASASAPSSADAAYESIETTPISGTDLEAAFDRAQTALFDALVDDPSPRSQVLVTRVWIPSDDATTVRPNREDVIARAVEFAPDDALVQWVAATDGEYEANHCGSMRWPDAEVANLTRIDPDNAGAWLFAVALARGKADEDGVDDALSHMAAAPHAEDRLVEEITAWTAVFTARPDLAGVAYSPYSEYDFAPRVRAGLAAMARVESDKHSAQEALEAVCTPDGSSERAWRRLGWCVDAGHLLAEKSGSLALRRAGLMMLKAAGDRSDETSQAERQNDWLEANSASPMQHVL